MRLLLVNLNLVQMYLPISNSFDDVKEVYEQLEDTIQISRKDAC